MVPTKEGGQPRHEPTFTAGGRRPICIAVVVVIVVILVAVAVFLGVWFGVVQKDAGRTTDNGSVNVGADSAFEIYLVLDQQFSSDLQNPETTAYKSLQADVDNVVGDIIKNSKLDEWYLGNMVIGFKYGTIVAIVKTFFKARTGFPIISEEVFVTVKKGLRQKATQTEALNILVDRTEVEQVQGTGNRVLGDKCSTDNDCADKNSHCSSSSSVCRCKQGYYDSNFENTTGGRCGELLGYGQGKCWEARNCLTSWAVCLYSQCMCNPSSHVLKDGSCVPHSEQPSLCQREIPDPNAILGQDCLNNHSSPTCKVTCKDGYRIDSVYDDDIKIFCVDGKWSTGKEEKGYGISNICLPEADFQKCPLSIPNGKIIEGCGPGTDWLCDFICNDGFLKHKYLQKGYGVASVYCDTDKGIWKTGYENIGLNISGACYPSGTSCSQSILDAHVETPCQSGQYCRWKCNFGFYGRMLTIHDGNFGSPFCLNGELKFMGTMRDPSITPENACVSDNTVQTCPTSITNGRIYDQNCKRDCAPICDKGFFPPSSPSRMTCENGKWLTTHYAYTGDNFCRPEGGHSCPDEIPNGVIDDFGLVRYKCSSGFRQHRAISYLNCVAGKWITGQERFNIGVNALCIPFNSN